MSFKTKSPAMQYLINGIAIRTFGMSVSDAIENAVCVCCHHPAYLTDELSVVEYNISGLCSECQDGIFGEENEN